MPKKIIKHLKQGTLFENILIKTLNIYRQYIKFILVSKVSKPYEVVYVPTDTIEYAVVFSPQGDKLPRSYNIGFSKQRIVGWIEKGDWDKHKKSFNELPKYSIFKERFVEGKEWEETGEYERFHEALRNSGVVRGYKNWAVYKEKKLKIWDDIYNQTKKNGLKMSQSLKPRDNIEVVVSRQGEILFRDGRHRLTIAKILNVREVPVIVNHWHIEFINEVKRSTGKKKITPSEAIKIAIEKHKERSK